MSFKGVGSGARDAEDICVKGQGDRFPEGSFS